jgi:aryl-alcohol dehydrogenase-like predicted oxidoreductase
MRTLGTGGLTVSSIGLGCMGMSGSYGAADEEESIRTVHRALDLGVTFFDTADVYGYGENERLVERALGPRRKDVVLATKCGLVTSETSRRVDGSPAHISAACDASLARLRTDVIDLYYLHRVDPRTPIEDSVGALAELVQEGKVRFIGVSEASASTIRRGHSVHPISAVQSEYSLWFREPEERVLPVCRELGIGFVPFSPIGRGFLTGTLSGVDDLPANDMRRRVPRFTGDHLGHNIALVTALSRIAAAKGCSTAQLSLAWLLARGDDIVPIPGTRRRGHLEENVGAADVVLTPVELNDLDTLFAPNAPSGERYPEDLMRLVDRMGG